MLDNDLGQLNCMVWNSYICADIPLCIGSWTHCETVGGARMQIACGWSSGDISTNINSVKVRRKTQLRLPHSLVQKRSRLYLPPHLEG